MLVLSAVIKGSVVGVAINFFDLPCIQEYRYSKDKDLEKSTKGKSARKKIKKRSKSKDRNFLKFMLYIFFFSMIGSVVVYDQKPELFSNLLHLAKDRTSQVFHNLSSKVFSPVENSVPLSDDVKSLDSQENIVSTISSEFTDPSDEIVPDFLINSRSLISSVINTLNLYEDYNLLLLSGSGGRIDLEFLGKKSLIVPVDSIGDVLNYSLRQVSGEDQYKHGFLVKYSAVSISNESNSKVNIDNLKSLTSNMKKVLLKTLPPIFDSSYKRTPVILRVEGFDNIMKILNYLSANGGSNTTLDKFVFKTFENNLDPSAFYYIAINDELDSK